MFYKGHMSLIGDCLCVYVASSPAVYELLNTLNNLPLLLSVKGLKESCYYLTDIGGDIMIKHRVAGLLLYMFGIVRFMDVSVRNIHI